jgi:hypothetical protein
MSRKVYAIGVGMTKFEEPGSKEWEYPDIEEPVRVYEVKWRET